MLKAELSPEKVNVPAASAHGSLAGEQGIFGSDDEVIPTGPPPCWPNSHLPDGRGLSRLLLRMPSRRAPVLASLPRFLAISCLAPEAVAVAGGRGIVSARREVRQVAIVVRANLRRKQRRSVTGCSGGGHGKGQRFFPRVRLLQTLDSCHRSRKTSEIPLSGR